MSVNKFIEFMNLYLSAFDFCVMMLMVIYLIEAVRKHVEDKSSAVQLAFGLLIYVSGHFWLRGWTWIQWYHTNHHPGAPVGPSWSEDPFQIPMFSAGIVIVSVGLIYILKPLLSMIHRSVWYFCIPIITLLSATVTWFT